MTEKIEKRFLVVEDHDGARRMVSRVLRSETSEVLEAVDGAEALAALHADPNFDLLVTDVDMPKMSGFELIEALDSTGFRGAVVVMTGMLDADRLAKLEALVLSGQLQGFLAKPFSPQKLREAVTRALGFIADRDRIDARRAADYGD